MKKIIKKQEKEFKEKFKEGFVVPAYPYGNKTENHITMKENDIKNFISKIRKETAEYVADKIIEGNKLLFVDGKGAREWENGYNIRIKEEKEIKKEILTFLNK